MIINSGTSTNIAKTYGPFHRKTGEPDRYREGTAKVSPGETRPTGEGGKASGGPLQTSEGEKKEVEQLKKRDGEVRNHERAHIAAGGPYVRGGASYEMKQGPDGRSYAVGGEVSIDVSPVKGDPDATIRKMQTVRRAALAPADPSPQDRAVAAQTVKVESEARLEKSRLEKSSMEKEEGGSVAEPEKSFSRQDFALSRYKSNEGGNRESNKAGSIIETFA